MPGAVISIDSQEGRRLRDDLRGAPGVTGTVLVGDAIHVFVDDGPRRLAELEQRLRSDGIEFVEIAEVPPSIEDLFVTATTSDREAA